jgi:hypothetical protein
MCYRIPRVVWGVAVMWLVVSILSLIVGRMQKPGRSPGVLQQEIRSDQANA